MAVGDLITAARYNNLQSRLATILGNGTGLSGYGQTVTSGQVSGGNTQIVSATDMDELHTDMVKCRQHQVGSAPTEITIPVTGDVIAEETSNNPNGSTKGYADYENLMTTIENDKLLIALTQSTLTTALQSSRTTPWNGVVTHTVTFTFANADARRHFFNSGGEIRFSSSLTGGSGSKDSDWAAMLTNMGTIKFNYTQTSSTGTGSGSAIGNYDLTSTYQQVFIKSGSGVYAENDYNIAAREVSATQIQFKIEFRDDDAGDQRPGDSGGTDGVSIPGPGEDENVGGTLSSVVQTFRASGSFVDVAAPTGANNTTL